MNYCKDGDIPKFKLYKAQTGDIVDLYGDVDSFSSNNISVLDGLTTTNYTIPNQFYISSIYPNPFNPTATIDFSVPSNMRLSINIIDLQGRVVDMLIEENYVPGNYSIQYNASNLSSGVYFVQLKNQSTATYSKIILLK